MSDLLEIQETIVLNTEQQEAVDKLGIFLETPSCLTWEGTEYYGAEIKSLILSLNPEESLRACKLYIVENAFCLSGPAGAGKTFTVKLATKGRAFTYCAPTFQACAILSNSVGSKVHTLASALGTTRLDKSTNDQNSDEFYLKSMESIQQQMAYGNPPAIFSADLLLIDEASMIGGNGAAPKEFKLKEKGKYITIPLVNDTFIAMALRLLDRIKTFKNLPSKFVFLGDYAQTPPVGTEADNDAELLESLMETDERFVSLIQVMRTNHKDIQDLLLLYRLEIDRLNMLRKTSKTLSSDPLSFAKVLVVPIPERKNSENIYYYNQAKDFLAQFISLYKNRPLEFKYDSSYVSIINFNNEVNPKTKLLVNRIRTELFGDASTKYHAGETLLSKSSWAIKDKVTGRETYFEKDSRVFLESVSYGSFRGRLSSNIIVTIELPNLVLRTATSNVNTYAASEFFTTTINNIRNGKRYVNGRMNLTDDEMNYFGLKYPYLKYSDWLELLGLIPDFGYAYVVNNFKIQGSSLKFAMVDESNLLTSPATPKKRIQYIYTAISRGREKLFIYNQQNLTNTAELIQL